MTIVIRRAARRPLGVLAVVTAAGLTLAACGSGPSQVGAAAIVGDTVISVDQVQHELNSVLAAQPKARQAQQQGKLDQVSRGIVSSGILHQVVAQVEQREGINVTDQQVQQLIDQSGGMDQVSSQLLYDADGVRDIARDNLVERALAAKYADSLSVTFDYVAASSRADAQAKVNELAANPGAIDDLVKQASANGEGQRDQHLTLAQYLQQTGAAAAQQQAASDLSPLFGAPVNTVVAFQPSPQQSQEWLVALIRSHTVGPNTSKGASSADSADPGALAAVGTELMEPVAAGMNIRVSPRYGVWDPTSMQVVSGPDQTIGIESPVRNPQP